MFRSILYVNTHVERIETFVHLYFLWLDDVIYHLNKVLLKRVCSILGYCWFYICHTGFGSIGQFQSCSNDLNLPFIYSIRNSSPRKSRLLDSVQLSVYTVKYSCVLMKNSIGNLPNSFLTPRLVEFFFTPTIYLQNDK